MFDLLILFFWILIVVEVMLIMEVRVRYYELSEFLLLFSDMHIAKLGLLHCVTADVTHANVAVKEFFAHAFEAILELTCGAFYFLIAFGTKAFAPSAKANIFLLL